MSSGISQTDLKESKNIDALEKVLTFTGKNALFLHLSEIYVNYE